MRYVIIGNGVAGVTAAFAIRERLDDAAITVISAESDYFFSRTALMYAFMDRLTPRDLEPNERKVYDRQRIERVRGLVTDLDAGAHTLTLESGARIPYDRLLIAAGSRPNRPNWAGMDAVRDGLVNFVTLQDLEQCERLTKRGGRAVVAGGGLIGVELVECLHHHGMDVTFLVRDPWYWPAALGEAEGRMISEHIGRHGVSITHQEAIARVLTDAAGKVTGVVTESGKRLDCDLLGVTVGVHPATEWLSGVRTPPETGRGVVVDRAFRTSLPDVWAAGDCAEIRAEGRAPLVEQIWYSAKRQGEAAAKSMLGDGVAYAPPIFYNSSKFFEIEYTTVGSFRAAGSREFYARVLGKEVSVRIAEADGAVAGFNMLGSRWNHTVFERWIAERRPLAWCMDRLHQAQFDFEFGRQDLTDIRRQFAARRMEAAA
ncbi:MAG: FAD-dependent oxidoreductase [Acidobacteria bacterium]|nr:FAD-dependent oxidoreductase [Acidobacteriota bacterium]